MTLGSKIKKLRIEKGLTQKEVADLANVTFQTVSKWENDENEPDVETLKKLTKVFDCSFDDLFGENENSKGNASNKYRSVYKTDKVHNSTSIDRENGYISGIKKVEDDIFRKNYEFHKKQIEKQNYSKILNTQHDSLMKFFIDDEHSCFGFFFNYAPQFVCPFENLISFSLTNSNLENASSSTRVTGVGVGGSQFIASGFLPTNSTHKPRNYYLTINYKGENGEIETYKLKFDCYRSYIIYNGMVNNETEMWLFNDPLSDNTNKCLNEITSLLEAIKEQKVSKKLPDLPYEEYKKSEEEANVFLKEDWELLNSRVESQKHMLTKGSKSLVVAIVCFIIAIVIIIMFVALYNKYK